MYWVFKSQKPEKLAKSQVEDEWFCKEVFFCPHYIFACTGFPVNCCANPKCLNPKLTTQTHIVIPFKLLVEKMAN